MLQWQDREADLRWAALSVQLRTSLSSSSCYAWVAALFLCNTINTPRFSIPALQERNGGPTPGHPAVPECSLDQGRRSGPSEAQVPKVYDQDSWV